MQTTSEIRMREILTENKCAGELRNDLMNKQEKMQGKHFRASSVQGSDCGHEAWQMFSDLIGETIEWCPECGSIRIDTHQVGGKGITFHNPLEQRRAV